MVVVLFYSLGCKIQIGVLEYWVFEPAKGLRFIFTHYFISPSLQYSSYLADCSHHDAFSFSFDRTGTIAFSGHIWAQTAQPEQRSALM